MERTDRHDLPYLAAAQAQKHVTVNAALRALDALVHMSVLSATLAAEPPAPLPGDGYILPAGASGAAWSGIAAQRVVMRQDGAWSVFAPVIGMAVFVQDESVHRVWDGAAWVPLEAAPPTMTDLFGVNAAADGANRFSVKSPGVLHSHEDGGGDVRHVLNKAGETDTAAFLFQTGFSGRAEFGLTGGDDFAVKVSSDGAAFIEAIKIDRATGAVRLPQTAPRAASAAALADAADPVNQNTEKRAGALVWDGTGGRPVWASGPLATDPWVDGVGMAVHTPV